MAVDIYTGSNSGALSDEMLEEIAEDGSDDGSDESWYGLLGGLISHSMEFERIPSEPIYNYYINGDGDAVAKETIQIDGGTPESTPPTTIKTGLASWQILY